TANLFRITPMGGRLACNRPAYTANLFRITPMGGRLGPYYDLACNRPACTSDLQWNRIFELGTLRTRIGPYH
ncbi:hypothetical protein AVEN_118817-1, partial [Araneus ventricosus]